MPARIMITPAIERNEAVSPIIMALPANTKTKVNVVYPFTALTFVLVFAGSAIMIGETASLRSIAGVIIILAGIYLVSSGR